MRTIIAITLTSALGALVGCADTDALPRGVEEQVDDRDASLIAEVRSLAAQKNIGPLADPPVVRSKLVALGRALAFDKELSGNRNISCMSCHLPAFGTGDARSLSLGEGATGFGSSRVHPSGVFIPRNAPPLFNLHAMNALFWDGRVAKVDGKVVTPAGAAITTSMQSTFEFGAISALAMFPVTSRIEMRGASGTNELADIADSNLPAIWAALMVRLGKIPAYVKMFEAAYPGKKFSSMTFAHASNAIGAFLVSELTATDTPWDRFLQGDDAAMTDNQLLGAKNFLTARCHICHGGNALSDGAFHNVALSQFGPGVGNGPAGNDDWGRWNVTGAAADKYAFRTTPLRNVELTAPYGHAGEFRTLANFIGHYSNSQEKLGEYEMDEIDEPLLTTRLATDADVLATRDALLSGVIFPNSFRDRLVDFMLALTDPSSEDLDDIVPASVPSGLPIDRP